MTDTTDTSTPAPDGTPLGNLRHTVAALSSLGDDLLIAQGSSAGYPVGVNEVEYIADGHRLWSVLTLADLRSLLDLADALVRFAGQLHEADNLGQLAYMVSEADDSVDDEASGP